MYHSIEQLATQIKQQGAFLIGICGIPGSGKSHFAQKLHSLLDNSIVVPMDGFHLYRKDLTPDGVRFRGAAFTFDLQKFKVKVKQLSTKQGFPFLFPSFDHAAKDPVEDTIIVKEDVKHVIVEGLYLFDKVLELDCWDFKIWVECDIDIATERVGKRHFECGIEASLQQGMVRANDNDRKNSLYVQQHTNFQGCKRILNN